MVTLDDCLEAEDICKADPSFQKLMRERYEITDLATVACDPWYYGGRTSESPQHAQPEMLPTHAELSNFDARLLLNLTAEIWQQSLSNV